jgi:EmrB/QacA subfamily drug resistance transporter
MTATRKQNAEPASLLEAHPPKGGISATPSRKLAVAVVASAFVLEVLDLTIVNVAIPSIKSNLQATAAAIEWIMAGYALAFAVLLIMGGRLGDIFGYRRMFCLGVAGFSLSSLACGLAPTAEILVLTRLLQGASAALMAPQILSIIQILYPPTERFKVMGIFGLLGGLSSVLGPIIGGLLIELNLWNLSWRPIFLVNAPVGIAAIILAMRVLPAGASNHPLKLDFIGTALSVITLTCLVLPLVEGPSLGWPVWCLSLLGLTVPLLGIFWLYIQRRDRKDGSALIAPALFQEPVFVNGLVMAVLFNMINAGLFIASSVLMQTGLGLSPLQTSLLHAPFAIGVGLSIGILSRKIVPKLGPRITPIGVSVYGLGLIGFTLALGISASVTKLVLIGATFAIAGFGMGLVAAPLSSFALTRVDVRHAGAASGVYNTAQQLGAAFGVAVLGGLFLSKASHAYAQAFGLLVGVQVCLLLVVAALSLRFPRNLHEKATVQS